LILRKSGRGPREMVARQEFYISSILRHKLLCDVHICIFCIKRYE
jgi:hypothetical protein